MNRKRKAAVAAVLFAVVAVLGAASQAVASAGDKKVEVIK